MRTAKGRFRAFVLHDLQDGGRKTGSFVHLSRQFLAVNRRQNGRMKGLGNGLCGSFPPERRRQQRDDAMSKRLYIRHITAVDGGAEGQSIQAAALPDSEIDTSDIPELSDAQWQTAVRGRFHKPTKTVVTTRLDSDVLDWLKSQGSGYQSRMNTILRRVMLEAQRPGEQTTAA